MKRFFSFPNPVNDAAARTVALGVVLLSVLAFMTGAAWLLIPLTYGFVARVAAGPKISPLGWFAVHVTAPRLSAWQRFVPGPPSDSPRPWVWFFRRPH
ncbi:MAG: transporter permease [Acidimicrobiaceae bacterium]|nr:transporter permease [Acidimicrobiaceae bacterium]